MKLYHLLTRMALAVASAAIGIGAHAQQIYWTPTQGPYGSPSTDIIMTPQGKILAAVDRLYRSDDRGANWRASSGGLNTTIRKLLRQPGGNIIALGQPTSLYYSTDDGISWNQGTVDVQPPYNIVCLAAAPNGTLYAGGMNGLINFSSGIFRSTDSGRTWHYLSLGGMNVEALLADSDSTLIASVNGAGDIGSPSIRRSTDSGATWSIVTGNAFEVGGGASGFIIDSTGNYWASGHSGPWRSTDRGRTWDSVASPFHYPAAALTSMAAMTDGTIIAGTSAGPFRSTDNGTTWQPTSGWPDGAGVGSITAVSAGEAYAATDAGIFRSTEDGIAWAETNNGIPSDVTALAAAGGSNRIMVRTTAGVRFSNDGGVTWRRKGFREDYANVMLVTPSGDYFIGTNLGNLYRSTDGGTTWSVIHPTGSSYIYALGVNRSGTLLAGMASDQVHRSTDNGATWSAAPAAFSGYDIYAFAFDSLQSGYAATTRGIFRTTDNGTSWSTALRTDPSNAISVDRTGIVYAATTNGLLRSTDGGINWTNPTGGARMYTALAVDAQGTLYGATADSGVFRSTDRGSSWSDVSSGLPDTAVSSLAITGDGSLYAGTGMGLFRWSASPLGVEEKKEAGRLLATIAPNPFGERTTISFTIPAAGYTSLAISNSRGERIETLIAGRLPAGEHTIVWNAAGHAAGIYFYTLRSGERQVTGKMVVSR
jgi:photosystem II stability/assembly factor-like uncharacterized protein